MELAQIPEESELVSLIKKHQLQARKDRNKAKMENKTFENANSIEKFIAVIALPILFIGIVALGYAMAKGTGVLLITIIILLWDIGDTLDSINKKLARK